MLRMWSTMPKTMSTSPERSRKLWLLRSPIRVAINAKVPNIIRNRPKYGVGNFIKSLNFRQKYKIIFISYFLFLIFLYLCSRKLQK